MKFVLSLLAFCFLAWPSSGFCESASVKIGHHSIDDHQTDSKFFETSQPDMNEDGQPFMDSGDTRKQLETGQLSAKSVEPFDQDQASQLNDQYGRDRVIGSPGISLRRSTRSVRLRRRFARHSYSLDGRSMGQQNWMDYLGGQPSWSARRRWKKSVYPSDRIGAMTLNVVFDDTKSRRAPTPEPVADTNGRPRQKLLIGYLAGIQFASLGDDLLATVPINISSKTSVRDPMYVQRIPIPTIKGQSVEGGNGRRRRMAEPDPDPDPEPDPDPDPEPLDSLRIVSRGNNASVKLTMKELAIIFSRSDIIGTSKFLQGHLVSGALRYALEVVNNDPNLLPDYELTFQFYNTRGLTKDSVRYVMELWKMGAIAFIGPEDTCQTEAMMAAAQNLPMISFKCPDHSVSDKMRFNTFARTAPAEGEVAKATVAFLKQYNLNKFTVVCQADEVHRQLVEGIEQWVERYPNMVIQNTSWYSNAFNIDVKSSTEHVKRIIRETHMNTRVYVLVGDPGLVQLVMLEMGMQGYFAKGEYVVVYVDHTFGYIDAEDAFLNRYYRPTIYKAEDIGDKDSPAYNAVASLVEYSKSLFVIVPTPVSFNEEYKKFWSQVTKYNTEEPFKTYRTPPSTSSLSGRINIRTREILDNRYASYLYDAVMLYARALHETIEAKENYANGTAIMRRIFGRKYKSMQGFDVKIDAHGDAKGNFTVLTRQYVSPSIFNFSYSMIPTGWFVDTHDADGLQELVLHDKMAIDWIGGKPPRDEPECGFHGELCSTEPSRKTEIAGSVLAVLALVGGLIGLMVYRNRKIEKELAGLIWKIDPKEIQFITQDGYAAVLGASKVTLVSQDSNGGQDSTSLWPIDFHCLAKYRGALVAIKEIQYARKLREITRATKMEMKKMRSLHHDNVNNFMGIIVKCNQIYVVREYCAKGSLYDVLLNENIKLDELFTASFIDDLLKAMCYLHESELKVHGNLKSTNCVVTSRWSLQVSDFGLHELREGQQFENEMQRYKSLLWTAPELLLEGVIERPQRGTQKGDVFSFGIVLHEIFSRSGPYGIEADGSLSTRDIYMLIIRTRQFHQSVNAVPCADEDLQLLGLVNTTKPYLPNLDDIQCQNYVKETLMQCWDERQNERPDFRSIRQRLKPLFKGILRRNIMDHMMAMMEKYQNHLEQLVDERTEALNEEKKRVETLLQRMLPDTVASQLMRGEDVIPESYDAVTIYFSDIVGFTSLSAESTPMEVVNFLNGLYTLFDSIIRRYDVYKVETIGDAYMVVSGLPIRNDNHAGEIATMALHLLKAVETFQIPHRPDKKLLLRIGLHTGPCVAGVVGKTMPRYCLFGDTVNTASRMESNGLPLKIHCSEYVERALSSLGGYILEERGLVPMKGKGEMLTYWLLAKQEFVMASPVDEFPSEPLFKTKDTNRPPTGNLNRRRIAAESLHQLPSRGESLTTIIRRTPSKRTDAVSSTAASKLLQPAPAFSSTVGKPISSGGSNNSSRNSRTLLPTTTDHSAIGVQPAPSEANRPKLAPLILPSSEPPSYQDCAKPTRTKRQSLRGVCSNGRGDGGCRLTRHSSGSRERNPGLRKRSVSFPENVQALAEQFVSLGLSKDGRNGMNRDANGNVTVGSSVASSAMQTPKGISTTCSRNCTPDRNRPSLPVNALLSRQTCPALDPQRKAPSDKLKNGSASGKLEEFARNGSALTVARSIDGPGRHQVMKIIDSDEDEDEGSPVVRKRSLSCGDASNLAMIGNGPMSLAESTIAASDPQHIERALLTSNGSSALPLQVHNRPSAGVSMNSVGSRGRSVKSPLASQNQVNKFHRFQKAFLMENPDEDSPLDSPLLLKAEPSASFSGPDSGGVIDRHKRKRKSAVSLQAFRPFHTLWQGQDSRSTTPDASMGLATGGIKDKQMGSGNRLHRFLRYLKRPLSDDPLEGNNDHRLPSLV